MTNETSLKCLTEITVEPFPVPETVRVAGFGEMPLTTIDVKTVEVLLRRFKEDVLKAYGINPVPRKPRKQRDSVETSGDSDAPHVAKRGRKTTQEISA